MMFSAMNIKVGKPSAKLVLLKLADNANDKGECWPSFQNIADVCEMSRRSVIDQIDHLIGLGLITKTERRGPKGNSSNLYVLMLDGENFAPTPSEKSAPESVRSESVKESEKAKSKNTDEKIVNLYNEILADSKNQFHLPFVKVITEKRKKAIKKFWTLIDKDINRVESYFNWFITNAEHHRWIFGDNDRSWKADIEYICRDETFAKATENRLTDWRAAA